MGPFCRCASDCALVYDVLRGRDPADVASQDLPLGNPFAVNVSGLTLGVLPSAQDSAVEVRYPHASGPCARALAAFLLLGKTGLHRTTIVSALTSALGTIGALLAIEDES